jgi:amino acid transporter
MSEKKYDEPTVIGGEKDVDYNVGTVHNTSRRKSSAINPEILAGEIFDERYETTKRGLKSRYTLPSYLHGMIAHHPFTAMLK